MQFSIGPKYTHVFRFEVVSFIYHWPWEKDKEKDYFAAEENMTHLNTLIEGDRLDSYISETDVTLYALLVISLYGIPAA